MKTLLTLSLATLSLLQAETQTLQSINVESTYISEVAQNAKQSADVAQALSTNVPSIDMSRRSGIANDILIRGQKRDNITVEVDGAKVYGACPNRMDPPISHILANQIQAIEVIEGPYDVESFGTLSGGVKIKTKKPSKKAKGEINVGAGSFNYKKFGASASGGNERIRMSIAAAMESSDQYKDGNGDTLADQIDNYAGSNPALKGVKLQPQYHDMQAYSKKSIAVKAFIPTLKDQELRLSVTANRSDDILYANSKMDALYDNSNLYSVEYNINNLSDTYKNINLQYYHSDVDHPMANNYRVASQGTNPIIKNHLQTSMDGLKLKNILDIATYNLTLGLDGSKRNWSGHYEKNDSAAAIGNKKSIDNSDTNNIALFSKLKKDFDAFTLALGMRYDETTITNDTYESNDYSALGANILGTYHFDKENKLFLGFGQASRVPDARELYFFHPSKGEIGTHDLKQTTNQEFDIGYKSDNDYFKLKIKAFYSMLTNYRAPLKTTLKVA